MAYSEQGWGKRPTNKANAAELSVDDVTASSATERALLASLLCQPRNFEVLPEGFDNRHFVVQDHGDIFDAAQEAAKRGATQLSVTVETALPHMAGRDGYIRQLVASAISALPSDARVYAQTLEELTQARLLMELSENLRYALTQPMATRQPMPAILARASSMLEAIGERQLVSKVPLTIGEAAMEAIRAGEEAALRGDGLSGISIGFPCLDQRLGGMEGGAVYVLAARPGMGKTALALQCALRLAEDGLEVGFISLEMEAKQIGRRALALRTNVHLADIKSGRFTKITEDAKALVGAAHGFRDLPLIIEDEPALTVSAIRLRAKAMKRRMGGLRLLVIDHLHIMGKGEAARRGDTEAITELSGGVKALAKELGIPILLLAQLNRGVEGREDKRPGLHDLRQSGAIEQDVDAAMFIYREEYYLNKTTVIKMPGQSDEKHRACIAEHEARLDEVRGQAEIIFDKVRDGQPGTEFLRFDGRQTRFHAEGDNRL